MWRRGIACLHLGGGSSFFFSLSFGTSTPYIGFRKRDENENFSLTYLSNPFIRRSVGTEKTLFPHLPVQPVYSA